MEKDYLILKRASASRPSGEWNDDDFDVLADGVVVGRILKVHAAPVGSPRMWTLAFGHHEDRTPTHGYATTREEAMAAFAKSWRRELTEERRIYRPPTEAAYGRGRLRIKSRWLSKALNTPVRADRKPFASLTLWPPAARRSMSLRCLSMRSFAPTMC